MGEAISQQTPDFLIVKNKQVLFESQHLLVTSIKDPHLCTVSLLAGPTGSLGSSTNNYFVTKCDLRILIEELDPSSSEGPRGPCKGYFLGQLKGNVSEATFTCGRGTLSNINYQPNERLSAIIQPGEMHVSLYFQVYDTEIGADHLSVWECTDSTCKWGHPLIRDFSGTAVPPVLTSNTGVLLLQWYSDATISLPGFVASWTGRGRYPDPATPSTCNAGFYLCPDQIGCCRCPALTYSISGA